MECTFVDDDYEFSDGCRLERGTGTGMEWDWAQSSTPSHPYTGPSIDHSPGDEGGFIFTEASSPVNTGDTAVVHTPIFTVEAGCKINIEFYYNMYGSTMGTLQVKESQNVLWSITDQQHSDGSSWSLASISLPSNSTRDFRFDFVGVRGDFYQSDMAIDDLVVLKCCSEECLTETTTAEATTAEEAATTAEATTTEEPTTTEEATTAEEATTTEEATTAADAGLTHLLFDLLFLLLVLLLIFLIFFVFLLVCVTPPPSPYWTDP